MKKVFKNAFIVALCAVGLGVFTSCDKDDSSDSYTVAEAVGSYAGTMTFSVGGVAGATPENLTYSTTADAIVFEKFPVASLVKAVLGDNEGIDDLIAAIGDVKYEVPYTAVMNEKKDGVVMTLAPKPLKIVLQMGAEIVVEVTVAAPEKANYAVGTKKMGYVLNATAVTVSGAPMTDFAPVALTFEATKK